MIYLDHAASSPVHPAVAARMSDLLDREHANPSSLHAAARSARKVIEEAREIVAASLGARPEEVIFTSGGTESDNLAVLGCGRRRRREGRTRVVVSSIEHHAVLDAADTLAAEGSDVVRCRTGADGVIDLEHLRSLVDERTALVSIMAANNETGVRQPIEEAARIARAASATFHTDAVQAFAWVDCAEIDADLISVSAHKLSGPKGVGALVVKRGTRIDPILHGGGQERALRPGTLDTVSIGGFGEAVRLLPERFGASPSVASRRDRLEAELTAIGGISVVGAASGRLPGHALVLVEGAEADTLLVLLDAAGICASSGSACASGAAQVSHVLRAMGRPEDKARGALRFSLGPATSDEDVTTTVEVVRAAVERSRGAR